MKKQVIIIGIDPGTITGIAVWDILPQEFAWITSEPIHIALVIILEYHKIYGNDMLVRWEDARKRKWFGKNSTAKIQGAGSIKRDCRIWEAFFADYKINNEPLDPKNLMTKLDEKAFRKITKWDKRTNEHSRDAAMMVFKYK